MDFFWRIDKPTDACDRLFRERLFKNFLGALHSSSMETATEEAGIGVNSREIYLSAIELAALLKISDNDLSRLARSGVLTRIPRPDDARAFLYPLFVNVTKYVVYQRSAKEKAYAACLQEKAKLQKIQRVRAELQHAVETGAMIPKERVYLVLGAGIIAYKQALLSRGERLEATLGQIDDREARVEAINGDDMRLLRILSDSLEALNNEADGQEG